MTAHSNPSMLMKMITLLQQDIDITRVLGGLTQTVTGAIVGALVVLVTFRTRLALMDSSIKLREAETRALERMMEKESRDMRSEVQTIITESENRIMSRIGAFDRRQRFMLEVIADFARAAGTDKRLGDKVLQFLSNELTTGRDD